MPALIIIGAMIGIIVLVCNIPVAAHIRYYGGKLDVKVRFMWLTLYPRPEKTDKPPGKKKITEKSGKTSEASEEEPSHKEPEPEESSPSDNNSSQDKSEASPEKKEKANKAKKSKPSDEKKLPLPERISALVDDLTEKKDAFLLLWELCIGPVKRLCGKIYVDGVKIDLTAANEDAYEAAMLYGKLNAGVYNAIAFMKTLMKRFRLDSVRIDCIFNSPKENSRYDGECRVKLRPASLLNAILAIVFGYLFHLKKYSPALRVFMSK